MKSYFSFSFCQRQITLLSLPWKTGPLNTYNLSKLLIFQIWLVHSTSSYFVSSISVSFKGLSINYVVWILNICDPSYRSYPTNIRRHQFFWGRVLGRKWKNVLGKFPTFSLTAGYFVVLSQPLIYYCDKQQAETKYRMQARVGNFYNEVKKKIDFYFVRILFTQP